MSKGIWDQVKEANKNGSFEKTDRILGPTKKDFIEMFEKIRPKKGDRFYQGGYLYEYTDDKGSFRFVKNMSETNIADLDEMHKLKPGVVKLITPKDSLIKKIRYWFKRNFAVKYFRQYRVVFKTAKSYYLGEMVFLNHNFRYIEDYIYLGNNCFQKMISCTSEKANLNTWFRYLWYHAVRLFGGYYWEMDRNIHWRFKGEILQFIRRKYYEK